MKFWISLCVVTTVLLSATVYAADPEVAPLSQEVLLERMQDNDSKLLLLDVRSPGEYVGGHVPGAVNVPYDRIASQLAGIPRDKDLVLYCRSGRRAQIAAEVLSSAGYTRLFHLDGDMQAWAANKRTVETPADPAACAAAVEQGAPATAACAPL